MASTISGEQSALGRALLVYMLAVTLLITLAPFRFDVPDALMVVWKTTALDSAANVFLFVPLGFLYSAGVASRRGRLPIEALALGGVLSLLIESAQLCTPGRYFSPPDVLTNALGAGAGALLHRRLQGDLDERLAGQLALQLPLMNVVYLLVPLLWLNGLAAGRHTGRWFLTPLLGLFGGGVIASVWANRLKPAGVSSPHKIVLIATAWFLLAAVPGLPWHPLLVCAAAVLVAGFVHMLSGPASRPTADHRFELATLSRLGPIYLAYLCLMSLWPWTGPLVAWRGGRGFLELNDEPGLVQMLRLIEYFAAFTLLGYLAAEYHSGRQAGARHLRHAAAWVAGSASLLEGARGFHPAHGASLARVVTGILAGCYGAVLYTLQLDATRKWLASPHKPVAAD